MKIIDLIGAIILMIGVVMIFDARPLTRKYFGFGDQNDGVLILKVAGFILSIAGCIGIYI